MLNVWPKCRGIIYRWLYNYVHVLASLVMVTIQCPSLVASGFVASPITVAYYLELCLNVSEGGREGGREDKAARIWTFSFEILNFSMFNGG